jgi:2-polyprenyl-3-methyl-5-hydroxy-6-metoxy-1,4-benzoquinol methylase
MSTARTTEYIGSELALFAEAANWRAYWQRQVSGFLGRQVLEVGAGIGSVTRSLCGPDTSRWVALEPDPEMAARLGEEVRDGGLPPTCEIRCATTSDLASDEIFDTALYIDVLEHIEDDTAEVARVCRHLAPGGHLIVLAPAHQALYTPFDAAIGHFRRYAMRRLLAVAAEGTTPRRTRYLDSVGLLASLANRLLLHSANPTRGQILLWDRWMVPLSRCLDPLFGYRCGKSALVIWQKVPAEAFR